MFEHIVFEAPKKSCFTAICWCGKQIWEEYAIDIKRVIAGGLIICWECNIALECTNCKRTVLSAIGMYDDDLMLIDDFPSNRTNVMRFSALLESPEFKAKCFSVMQELREVVI